MQACAGWSCGLQGLTCVCIFQLSFALLCDHCGSLLVTNFDICWFCSHPRIGKLMACGKHSTEFFFSVTVPGGWRSFGCHMVTSKARLHLLPCRPFHLLGTRSQAHLVDEFNTFIPLVSSHGGLKERDILHTLLI